MYTLTLKRHNSFQNENNRKTTHSFDPRPPIFMLKQEVLKFNDTCVGRGSPKTNAVIKFLKLEKGSLRTSGCLNSNF